VLGLLYFYMVLCCCRMLRTCLGIIGCL